MTIYDADFVAELQAQEEAYKTGVQDPVAVDQEASASQEPVDHIVEKNEMVEEPSDDQVAEVRNEISDKEMNFRALREELSTIKKDKERLAREFEDIKRAQVQRQPEPPRKRAIDDISNDDLVTGAQFKQIMQEREAEFQLVLGELHAKAKYSDYDEVTAKYGIPLLEQKPDLAQEFMNAPNKADYLYRLGDSARTKAEYNKLLQERQVQRTEPVSQPSAKAQRIVENSRKPGTLSNAVGGSAQMSQADYIASMNDSEFAAYVQKNLERI